MNNIYFDNFKNMEESKLFLDKNQGTGSLVIRASSANEAIPISNVKVIVSITIDNNNIIFFSGITDSSGMTSKITLPAPLYNENNLVAPLYTTYDIKAVYNGEDYSYKVNLYDDICVMQTINIIPDVMERKFYYYGN